MDPRKTRKYYLDILKIIATYAVVVVHTCTVVWGGMDKSLSAWKQITVFIGISKWPVQIFMMVTGVLFLGKEHDLKKIYTKYIPRMITALLFWSLLYVCLFEAKDASPLFFLYLVLKGYDHLWYLWMLVGFYMLLPFLTPIAADKKKTEYFLILAYIFGILIPRIITLGGFTMPDKMAYVKVIFDKLELSMVMGYPFYFFLGHYLDGIDTDAVKRIVIYLFGIAGALFTVFGTFWVSNFIGAPAPVLFDLSTNTLLMSIAVYVFVRQLVSGKEFRDKTKKIIEILSKYSFGVYLTHMLVIAIFANFGLTASAFIPVITVPLLTVAVFIVSYLLSALINNIPILKKYIV